MLDFCLAKFTIKEYLKGISLYKKSYLCYLFSVFTYIISSGVIIPILFKNLIDNITTEDSSDKIEYYFIYFLVLYSLFAIINMIFRSLADIFIARASPYIRADLESKCFQEIHRKNYNFFVNRYSGALLAKVKRFILGFDGIDFSVSRRLFETSVLLFFSMLILGYYSLTLFFLFMFWGIFILFVVLFLLPKKIKYDLRIANTDSKVSGQIVDSISNFLALKVFATHGTELERLKDYLTERANAIKESWYYSARMTLYQLLAIFVSEIIILILGYYLYINQEISIGTLVLLFTYLIQVSKQLYSLTDELKRIVRSLTGALEMSEILYDNIENEENINFEEEKKYIPYSNICITFKDACFSYNERKKVFSNFSLDIRANERVGLVGYSGAGKSTLFKLLLRLIEINKGSISLNKQSLSSISRVQISNMISYVPQEPEMFHRSILENIIYGSDVKDLDTVRSAAKKAYIDDMIMSLPNRYDTLVGERGIKLSTGEKQRLIIARAFLRNNPVILMDEPTSSLDSESEYYIQKSLDELFEGKTVLVIAHRLSTVQKLDRILVLENGKVIEEGNHDELISKGKVYNKLWELQS